MANMPMANGHLDADELEHRQLSAAHRPHGDPVLPNGPPLLSVQPQHWTDIRSEFGAWSTEVHPGELLSTPAFTLYDAMSAIELMDVKMDIGLSLKDRKIKSFEDGVTKGLIKLDNFTCTDYLAVMDRSLPFVIMWMQGHCVAQTVFTMLYLHKPDAVNDELMHAYCITILELIDHIRQIMLDGGVVEEEDFQVMSPIAIPNHFPNLFNDPSKPKSSLSKSLKTAEETCSRNARRLKAASGQETDESAQWNAVALRFKFLRTLVQFISAFRWRSETFFAEAPQQLEVLQSTLEKISSGYILDKESVMRAPGFEPLINLHLLPPSFPRHTPLSLGEETFGWLKRLVEGLKTVIVVRENVGKLDALLGVLRRECGLHSLAVVRSMMQIVIGHSLGINLPPVYSTSTTASPPPWFQGQLGECIVDSIRLFTSAPVFLPSLPHTPELIEYSNTFVRSCAAVLANLLRVYGLNKARQRDALGVALVDIFTLQEDAEKLDDFFNQQLMETRLVGFTHNFCLASWTLITMLSTMSEYLLSGFELDLYAQTELHFVYWYLYDVLYHCEIQTVARADNAVRENEAGLAVFMENELRAARKNGKKKPTLKSKTSDSNLASRPHRTVLARAQSLQYLCGAYQLTVLGLQMQGKIRPSDDSLDSEEFRYYNRLMPFMERNAPAFVDYEHYCAVRSVLCDGQPPHAHRPIKNEDRAGNALDIFRKASQNIQNAEKLFPYWTDEDQKIRLTKICRRNDVILKILATGRNCKGVELVHDEHPWFPSLKLL